MDRNTKIWILALLLFCALCLGLFFALRQPAGGTVAVISVDGDVLDRIDLSQVKESYDIEVDTGYGLNLVHVEPGGVSVIAADCPDKVCMAMGQLRDDGIPIVCMPHHLVIEIEGSEIDG